MRSQASRSPCQSLCTHDALRLNCSPVALLTADHRAHGATGWSDRWSCSAVFMPSCLDTSLLVQKDEHLFMLDYIGPPGFAAEAAKHCGRCCVLLLSRHQARCLPALI